MARTQNDDPGFARTERLLRFLVARFPSLPALDAALSRIEFSVQAEGLDAPALDRKENFKRLLDHANARGWSQLLIFAVFSAGDPVGDRQAVGEFLNSHESLGLELYERLRNLEATVVRAAYDRVIGDFYVPRPEGTPVTPPFVALSIMLAQEATKDARVLYEFLRELLAAELEANVRQELTTWWARAAEQLGLKGSLARSPRRNPERHSVIIELRDAAESTPDKPAWRRIAWLYRHRTDRFDRLDDDLPDEVVTLATIPQYVSDLRDRLEGRGIEPLDAVVFEFFVRETSLYHALDKVSLPFDPDIASELGFENPVIVRALDRRPQLRAKVRSRWERLRDADVLDAVALVSMGTGGDVMTLYRQFDLRADLQCLILQAPFGSAEDLAKLPCVKAAIAAGLPLIVWARNPAAASTLPATVNAWSAQPPRALPDRVRELRRLVSDDPNHLGRHLTLFFENGDYWLPSNPSFAEAR